MAEIELLMMENSPRVVALQEIRMATPDDIPATIAQNYRVASFAARDTRGGGVCILTHRSVLEWEIQAPGEVTDILVDFEHTRAVIQGVLFINIYAPPRSKLLGFKEFIHRVTQGQEKIVLLGDFNAENDLWRTRMDTTQSSRDRRTRGDVLLDTIISSKLCLCNDVQQATTVRGGILDLTFANAAAWDGCGHEVLERVISGVHKPILFRIKLDSGKGGKHQGNNAKRMKNQLPPEKRRDYCREIDSYLGARAPKNLKDTSHMLNLLRGSLIHVTKIHGKRFNAASTKSQEWKGADWRGDEDDFSGVTREDLNCRRNEHFQKLISNMGSKPYCASHLYDCIKMVDRRFPTFYYSGKISPDEAANKLKQEFRHEDAADTAEDTAAWCEILNRRCKMSETAGEGRDKVTIAEVDAALLQLRKEAAPGPDGLETKQLIWATESKAFKELVAELTNTMLRTGHTPEDFHHAIIKPLPKESGGFRPVSMINSVDKLTQKIIHARLMKYFDNGGVQYGFQRGWNTEMLLEELVARIEDLENRGEAVAILSVDIKAAFDRVRPTHVAQALSEAGVPAFLVRYCYNYVRDRKFSLSFTTGEGTFHYGPYEQLSGCVQGSVLGPAIFLFCIQPLLNFFAAQKDTCDPYGFADDCNLLTHDPSEKALQTKLEKIGEDLTRWASAHRWLFSVAKCGILRVVTRNSRVGATIKLQTEIAGQIVTEKDELKILGVTLDGKLRFDKHADKVLAKITKRSKAILYLASTSWGVDQKSAVMLYKTIIQSLVYYGGGTWASRAPKAVLDKIQALMLSCIRICLTLPKWTPVGYVFYRSGAYTIREAAWMNGIATAAKMRSLGKQNSGPFGATLDTWFPEDECMVEDIKICGPGGGCEILEKTMESDEQLLEAAKDKDIIISTDGSLIPNSVGSFSYVIVDQGNLDWVRTAAKKIEGADSSYECELKAILAAASYMKGLRKVEGKSILWCTDSLSGLQKIGSRKYDRKYDAKAAEALDELAERSGSQITCTHVRGHAGIGLNEAADYLAGAITAGGDEHGPTGNEEEAGNATHKKSITLKAVKKKAKMEMKRRRQEAFSKHPDADIQFMGRATRGFGEKTIRRCGNKTVMQMVDLLRTGLLEKGNKYGAETATCYSDGGDCKLCGWINPRRQFGELTLHWLRDCPTLDEARVDDGADDSWNRDEFLVPIARKLVDLRRPSRRGGVEAG